MKRKKTSEVNKEAGLEKLLKLFKDDNGEQIQLTQTQKEIIKSIVFRASSRIGVICPTQYGKSTATALGIILRVFIFGEGFTIIGGTESKAKIIGRYVIKHLFDDDIFLTQLQITGGMLEKLKRERTKEYLTFRNGGYIRTMSAEYRNKKRLGDILLGEGSKNICIDDSALCDDDLYAYIKRMLGGQKENFLIELSNPLRKNHFYETMHDKDTKKIWIDYKIALQEGRFTEQFINEMRKEKFFDIFYECKFPESEAIDEKGYMQLFMSDLIDKSIVENVDIKFDENCIYGVDVGRGGDNTVIAVRKGYQAKILFSQKTKNTMDIVGIIKGILLETYNASPSQIYVDATGVGAGVVDRLLEQKIYVVGVSWATKALRKEKYSNLKAETFVALFEWLEKGGRIEQFETIKTQMEELKYKFNSSGQIILESKDDLLLRIGSSPDELDAIALTLTPNAISNINALYDDKKISSNEKENALLVKTGGDW